MFLGMARTAPAIKISASKLQPPPRQLNRPAESFFLKLRVNLKSAGIFLRRLNPSRIIFSQAPRKFKICWDIFAPPELPAESFFLKLRVNLKSAGIFLSPLDPPSRIIFFKPRVNLKSAGIFLSTSEPPSRIIFLKLRVNLKSAGIFLRRLNPSRIIFLKLRVNLKSAGIFYRRLNPPAKSFFLKLWANLIIIRRVGAEAFDARFHHEGHFQMRGVK